jgi:hypothetical protein
MNPAQELRALAIMADELPDYLLSDVLFWQLQASSNVPKLSLGMLLLTRQRLLAGDSQLSDSQQAERDAAIRLIETTLAKWQVASERKAEQELRARLNLWQRFWDDCREDPRACADNYGQEVSHRVMAELLLAEFPRLSASPEAAPLRAIDPTVRAKLQGDSFVWAPELAPGFPREPFWYLYGQPR